jgi:ferritin-like metal-binding protein YciE
MPIVMQGGKGGHSPGIFRSDAGVHVVKINSADPIREAAGKSNGAFERCIGPRQVSQSVHNLRRIATMTTMNSIEHLLVEELWDIYSAETQITKTLPKLIEAASSTDLKSAFEHHLKETEGHVERLDRAFEILGTSPKGKTCDGMKGILSEGAEMLHETAKGDIRDAALISAAQRVEHYEMAGYGTVRSYAEKLNRKDIVDLLQQTLEEEKAADKKLTDISQKINGRALRAA